MDFKVCLIPLLILIYTKIQLQSSTKELGTSNQITLKCVDDIFLPSIVRELKDSKDPPSPQSMLQLGIIAFERSATLREGGGDELINFRGTDGKSA